MKNTNPLISIVTVSFNSETTIRQTIQSVLNQTYVNIEYVIIDGGSTDATMMIVQEYGEAFSKKNIAYKFLSEPDKGIYDAMNKGIHLCEGKWIGIINSDDYYETDALELVHNCICDSPDAELIYGNITLINELGVKSVAKPNNDLNILTQTMTIFHPTVFIKREIYMNFGLFDLKYKLCADWDLILRLYLNRTNFQYVNGLISNFRAGGAGSGLKVIHLKERYRIRREHLTKNRLWYNFKDFLIFLYFKISAKKSLD